MNFIAELCQNHNGDIDVAKKMIDEAAAAGATHIKIQHIYVRNLTFRPEFETGLVQDGVTKCIRRPYADEYERLSKLELSTRECESIVNHILDLKLTPMTTCFARSNLRDIKNQGFSSLKIASYDCASFPMLREAAKLFGEIIVSTGATYDEEVIHANAILKNSDCDYSLLHCVTQYPTPLTSMHFNRIKWLQSFCSSVGFSDHSLVSRDDVIASKVAIYLGCNFIERHFTILPSSDTKDGPVSISANHVRDLCRFSDLDREDQLIEINTLFPNWESSLGQTNHQLSDEEKLNRSYYRGRFASPRFLDDSSSAEMIYNWEETPLP